VIVNKNNQILASGYAGSPPGLPHCDAVGHKFEETRYVITADKELTQDQAELIEHEKMQKDLMSNIWVGPTSIHCVRTIHAEINAINQAAKCGHPIDGSTFYVSFTPCYRCAMSLISVGCRRVVCKKRYANAGTESEEAFKKVGIELVYLEK
jgi:dCMP deaminase